MIDADDGVYTVLRTELMTDKQSVLVGQNTVKRALTRGSLSLVVVALDAQSDYVRDMVRLCKDADVKLFTVHSGKRLGEAVDIDVRAMCVGVCKKDSLPV